MNIAILCKTFLKGGAEKQALILTKLLIENGFNVCLINWYGEKVDKRNLKFISDNSFRYYPMTGNHLKKFIDYTKILKQEGISVILSYLTLSNFLSGLSKLLFRGVISIGGIRNEKLPFHKFLFERFIHNYFNDATIFNNYSAKEKLEKRGFNSGKIYVIQNAIEIINSKFNVRVSNGKIKIATVGRFVKQKDFGTALKSFSYLVHKNSNKQFIYYIVGYGPLENQLRSLSERLKVNDRIKFLINPSDIGAILDQSDIFLSTSLFEGVSNSIMEAMVAGLPVVATNVGDNKFLIKDGHNGYLVPCSDVGAIVEKLEYLSGSEEIRNEFGKNSLKVIETEFSQNKMLSSYLSLLSKFQ